MIANEIPVVFECESEILVGMIHSPEKPNQRGILAFAAGGPQYRVGVSRQLVYTARKFSELGIPFMRFDYRGMGDSTGAYRGFKYIEKDLAAAIRTFFETVPSLKDIILWGGCDAASGVMLHGSSLPEVKGMIIMNPFTVSSDAQKSSLRHYYIERLFDKSFWNKVFSGRFNPFNSIKFNSRPVKKSHKTSLSDDSFVKVMFEGIKRFKGPVLLVMNKKNFVSRRFDQSIKKDKNLTKIFSRKNIERVDLSSDGQEFAMEESRKKMMSIVESWFFKK